MSPVSTANSSTSTPIQPSRDPRSDSSPRLALAALFAGWLAALGLDFLPAWIPQWLQPLECGSRDSQIWMWVLPLAPLAWMLWNRPPRHVPPKPNASPHVARVVLGRRELVIAAGLGCLHLLACVATDLSYGSPYPAYHDEFSYLFQAKTFLAGRWGWPSHEVPELFDQMHVLNTGVFASRYFPGAGLWVVPFLAAGLPEWAMPVAGGLAVACAAMAAMRLGGTICGAVTGGLLACSPGAVVFHSLVLAHAPTLLGLSVLVLAWTHLDDVAETDGRRAFLAGTIAGVGLCLAMLSRPLTAAAIALPYGVGWLVEAARNRRCAGGFSAKSKGGTLGLGVALACGFAVLAAQNRAITGSVWLTPYSVYNATYTPSHAYGFDNVVRGRAAQAPRAIRSYEDWAENLTLPGALANTGRRGASLLRWSLGGIPVVVLLCATWWVRRDLPRGWMIWPASIATLLFAYFGYWFDGIQHWHYAYEAILPLCLWMGAVFAAVLRACRRNGRPLAAAWCWGALALAVVGQYRPVSSEQPSLYAKAVSELRFAKTKYARVYGYVEATIPSGRALVVVRPDPADRHMDYVANSPSLDDRILYARDLPELAPPEQLRKLFPDRALFMLDIPAGTLTNLEQAK
jgi:hypothetical protein